MRADGVEVAQQHDVPLGVGLGGVHEDLLDHPLGPAVGVGAELLGALLGEGQRVGVAVDGRRAGEDDVLAAVVAHGLDQVEGAAEVVVVVLDGLGHALADGLEAGEVDHAVDVERLEDGLEGVAVAHVGADERHALGCLFAHDLRDAVENLLAGVGEVVDDDDLIAAREQLDDGVAPDEAGSTGHKYAGFGGCFLKRHGSFLRSMGRRKEVYASVLGFASFSPS